MKTVRQTAALAGISVRTLHYYDQIGLLRPGETTGAGYRLYGERELLRLQHILFLRELDFPLAEIGRILDDPGFDAKQALQRHKRLLEMKRNRLDGLIRLADELQRGELKMYFEEFDLTEIEKAKKEYRSEAEQRWGSTAAYAQSVKKTDAYTKEDWQDIARESGEILKEFARNMDKPPNDPAVRRVVKHWQDHISARYYDCTDEILAGLGGIYAADERFQKNIDKVSPGLAQFMSEAIAAYCN